MRVKTLILSGPVLWATVLLLPLLLLFGARNNYSVTAYWESATADSTMLLGFVYAVCGACAAWEAGRLKKARIASWAPVRSRMRVAGEHLAPVAALGVLGILASLAAFSGPALGAPGGPDLAVLGTEYAIVLSHMALGYLIGQWLPRLLAPALTLLLGYFWGSWPAALDDPMWLRHVAGQGLADCCTLDQEPSLRSLAASVVFSVGILAAALVVLAMDGRVTRWALAVALAFTGSFLGIAVADPLGLSGVQARDRSQYRCEGTGPQVCLWPEQRAHRADFVRWSRQADRALTRAGVSSARRVSFGTTTPHRDDVLVDVATSMLPTEPPACAQRPNAVYPGDEAYQVLYPWLALTAGVRPDDLLARWPSDAVRQAQQVRRLPLPAQKAWFERNLRSVRDCSVAPDLSPSSYVGKGAGKKSRP
ncbi:hypothetical protein RKE29_11700 [Streptomyces sp. B1866]|uniref:DUF7224 domain-containing protein n=1 Tax=Streptomyces sp. B1866 TaxID=3075431 RepID=UPI0028904322|nr:hypothetical protein [Streptomyces sp. B1866]MDT3397303.1 hypothetical protein [Streptomyces sp. B1866]